MAQIKEWHDCGELKHKPKYKWVFVYRKEAKMHRTELCAAPLCEMQKEQQIIGRYRGSVRA